MYVAFSCYQCKEIGYDSNQAKVLSLYRDDGIYNLECKRGHKFTGTFQCHLYQILFEIGAYAIIDGYYRESVASFTSSLERFFEYYLKVVSVSRKTESVEFANAWKNIAAQSERQFGAFIFVYLLVNKKSPDLATEKYRKFRNDVIHKGKIPSKEKAIEYGDCVKTTIEDLSIELCNFDIRAMNEVMRRYLEDLQTKTGDKNNTSVAHSTIIGNYENEISNWGRPNLETHLERIEHVRSTWLKEYA